MANIINAATMDLIKAFEGLRTLAYPDPATGGEPWTIGYGHTTSAGPPVVARGLRITPAFAEAILIRDLETVAGHVAMRVKVHITDNQFGGLVSFTFNVGPGNLDKSTLLKKVNAKDFAGAVMEFAKWNKANKKVMAGLTRRRAAEASLFLAPPTIAKNATVAPAPRMAPFPPTSVHHPHPPAGPVAADFEPTHQPRKVTPMQNWFSGIVTSTMLKYLIAMIATFAATKFGLEEATITGILTQLVGVVAGLWGMFESSKSKVVLDGKRVLVKDMTKVDQRAVEAVVAKSIGSV